VKIANFEFEPNVVLAPMAGVTSAPFRLLARRYGAGMSWSELISSAALVLGGEKSQEKSHQLAWFSEEERPGRGADFRRRPNTDARSGGHYRRDKTGRHRHQHGLQRVQNRQVRRGLHDDENARSITESLRRHSRRREYSWRACNLKMRAGWDANSINAPEMAKRAQDVGISAVSVHPRTAKQAFTGKSDWNVIRLVKEAVEIPVIGCGDVENGADAKRMLDETGCDAVMIGRAAQGNPFLFASVAQYLKDGTEAPEFPPKRKLTRRCGTRRRLIKLKGERTAMNEMRRHAAWYTKGMPESSRCATACAAFRHDRTRRHSRRMPGCIRALRRGSSRTDAAREYSYS
jgi:tRNA-dihydrouridine synthase